MFNIFEMMQGGKGQAGLDGLARQFGISPEQATRAATAVLPALVLAMQRSVPNPSAFANLMSGFNAGPFTNFFNNPGQPVPPQAQAQGEQMLGQIFGSADLTRRVAEQAATWSGVSAQIIQQMMPIMAGAVVGSLSQFSDIMRSQASGGAAPAAPSPATPASALAQPFMAWTDMMRLMTGVQPTEAPKPAPEAPKIPTPPEVPNPWADMARAMMGQSAPAVPQPAAKPEPKPKRKTKPRPRPQPEPAASEGAQGGWAGAIESGREAQQQYVASLQNILDTFWGRRLGPALRTARGRRASARPDSGGGGGEFP